jgi:cyclopropane fatty-acyl-phospholipid synthase-like methyltransferase
MNYGLWKDNYNLLEANQNLIHFLLEKSDLINKKNKNILDVGCGYGEQDIEWSKKLHETCQITAIDISTEQIYNSIIRANKENIKNINYEIFDALLIQEKYKNKKFDVIFSVESAFHYSDRNKFFENVNNLLEDDGKFLITDIMLKNNNHFCNNLFVKIFSDCLHIPNKNLIKVDDWDKQLQNYCNIIETIDLTEQVYNKYYEYFIITYSNKKKLPNIIKSLLLYFMSYQPFSYRFAICSKKN